jgi:hypothetical protein
MVASTSASGAAKPNSPGPSSHPIPHHRRSRKLVPSSRQGRLPDGRELYMRRPGIKRNWEPVVDHACVSCGGVYPRTAFDWEESGVGKDSRPMSVLRTVSEIEWRRRRSRGEEIVMRTKTDQPTFSTFLCFILESNSSSHGSLSSSPPRCPNSNSINSNQIVIAVIIDITIDNIIPHLEFFDSAALLVHSRV